MDGQSDATDALSVAPNALDVDVEEVADRVDLLRETVDQLAKDK